MQSEYSAPIEMYKEGRKYFYKYEDPEFSIKTLPVGDEDLATLNTAVNLLQQIKGFTIAEEIAEIVSRLESRYKFTNQGKETIISFDNSPGVKGLENLEDIYHALIRKNVLKITYQTFQSNTAKEWTIHPYLLKEYSNRWYLLGYCEEVHALGIYALDRMKSIKIANSTYRQNGSEDPEMYFEDIIGVTKPSKQEVEQIDIMFTCEFAPYVLTKPIHTSQTVIERYADGSLHIRLSLIINPELISLLLSFGKYVRVLGPERLALEIQDAARILLEHYP
jgi:predicted DNA-binding transcriptional regulator YafY